MVERFFRSRDNKTEAKTVAENKPAQEKEVARATTDDYRSAAKLTIDNEVKNLIEEEIHRAAQELAEEQRKVIKEAVEQQKQIIRDVLEEEKAEIHERVEELRRSIISLGRG